MNRIVPALAFLVIVLAAAACSGGGGEETERTPAALQEAAVPGVERGGTLRAALSSYMDYYVRPVALPPSFDYFLDPQRLYDAASWELFRCCLLRTMLSYNGRPTSEGGIDLHPDLAAEMPKVSSDGLTWTFRLKKNVFYGPPFEDVEVTAPDFIRALARTLTPTPASVAKRIGPQLGAYGFYFVGLIGGAQEFSDGKSDTISGLEAPDPYTLVVHLTEPAGDLGYRFTLAATAPIPPSRNDPGERLGAADGHDDGYGRFLVSTGPYMLEGSESLDFTAPPGEQKPAAGYVRGERLVLVRNPSWDPATDSLRPAYVDRIELPMGGTPEELALKVDRGELDFVLDANATFDQVERYEADPKLIERVLTFPCDWLFAIPLNLALPPLDDVHVRRAVSLAMDKRGLHELLNAQTFWWGYAWGETIGHIASDAVTSNLLVGYDPYRTPNGKGNLARARKEMALSRYDSNGDGVCDKHSCGNLRLVTWNEAGLPKMAALVRRSLAQIGLGVDVTVAADYNDYLTETIPSKRTAMTVGDLWGGEYPNGSAYFVPHLARPELNGSNVSLLGATTNQLEDWGYPGATVPSVDDRIGRCLPLTGRSQVECWAQIDQVLMETIVPWVPYALHAHSYVVSGRITNFALDQFTAQASLDQVALRP